MHKIFGNYIPSATATEKKYYNCTTHENSRASTAVGAESQGRGGMKQPRTHGAKLRGGTDAEETSIVSHEEERQNRLLHDVYNSQIFASDLDGTLMIPSEFKQEGDIPVDWYNGEPCAYMTPFVYENLPKILDKLIPVTSRSVQRYKRIKFFQEHVPEFALCAMGMFFVWKGMANDSWSNSRWLSRSAAPHIKHCSVIDMCYGFLAGCPETKRLRISGHKNDIIFLYAVAKHGMCDKLDRKLRSFLFGVDYSRMSDVRTVNYGWDTDFTKSLSQHFTVARDDKKLYVMPKGCNKKDGLYRFVTDWLNEPWRLDLDYNDGRGKWVSPDQPWEDKKTKRKYKIICAGDSEMDEPMYDLADVVLSKANYEKSGSTDRFSDWVLKRALEELDLGR